MFSFHPIIQENYIEVQDWLSEIEKLVPLPEGKELNKYRTNSAWSRVDRKLKEDTFESAALQYYVLFPGHAAKIGFTLKNVIGEESIVEWLEHNPQTTVIDVGCGAGTASVAFINHLLKLRYCTLTMRINRSK